MDDSFGRHIDYLRISVTDRCNLRCRYCMPEKGVCGLNHSDVLRYEEICDVVRAATENGVTKVRVTGGEPLVRTGITTFISMLGEINGIDEISLTTNGTRLAEYAGQLAAAGLDRVNISLDTLNSEKYRMITRAGRIENVLGGIEAAQQAGLEPVKINSIIIRGFNDDEIMDLSEWAMRNGLDLRFIEFMPVNGSLFPFRDGFMSSDDIKELVFSRFPGMKQFEIRGNGPSVNWRFKGNTGSIGFIEAVSHAFCGTCNRIRLTADGKLKPCLFSNQEVDLVPVLRGRDGDVHHDLVRLFSEAVLQKPESHANFRRINSKSRCMNEIGG